MLSIAKKRWPEKKIIIVNLKAMVRISQVNLNLMY